MNLRRVKRMKKPQILIIGTLVGLAILLSSCAPGPRVTGNPGISLSEDMVFVAFSNFVFGMDAETGNEIWRYPQEPSAQVLFFAQPYVNDEFVYVGDVANNFYKIDKETGLPVWTFSEANGFIIGQANEEDGIVYVPSNDGNLYAVDDQGALQWVFETGHFLWSQPQIGTNAIYQGSMDNFVYAISKEGDEIWSTELSGAVVGSPVLSEDGSRLYVGSIGGEMVAINTTDGGIIWSFDSGDSIWGKPVLADDTLYCANSSGDLYALDRNNGEVQWQQNIQGSVIGGLTALPDGIALVTEEGLIRVLAFDGSPLWQASLSGNVFQAPVVNDQYLMVAAIEADNLVYAFNLTGTPVWSVTPGN
jgi:outer membrane protein assembly factor BamB